MRGREIGAGFGGPAAGVDPASAGVGTGSAEAGGTAREAAAHPILDNSTPEGLRAGACMRRRGSGHVHSHEALVAPLLGCSLESCCIISNVAESADRRRLDRSSSSAKPTPV